MTADDGTPAFREVPGFPGYLVTPDAFIVSVKPRNNRWNNPKQASGLRAIQARLHPRWRYWRVDLCDSEGAKRTVRLAQVVAWAWLGPQPERRVVCHADGNTDHNHVGNLYYGTYTDNMLDRAYHARNGRGVVRPRVDADDASSYNDDETLPDGILEAGFDAAVGF